MKTRLADEYVARAQHYWRWDRRLSNRTRFFAAAAVTSEVLAYGLRHPAHTLLLSIASVERIAGLSRELATFNERLATSVGGVSTGLGYQCSLGLVNEIAPSERRSEMVSAYLVACYGGISLPVIGIGVLSGPAGSLLADEVFASLIIGLTLLALAALARSGRQPSTAAQLVRGHRAS
jgi:hypothetical protein